MKKIIYLLLLSILAKPVFSQTQFEVLPDKNGKTLKGIISRDILQRDTSFHWYAENLKPYTPNPHTIDALKKSNDSVQLLVFMGTWCDDSHFIIPKFYTLLDAAGFPDSNVTLVGVDRSKKTLGHLAEAMNVINVPTIIVLRKGIELGRVVEYGKYGVFDQDLGEILNGVK